jgi:hypothetical protein
MAFLLSRGPSTCKLTIKSYKKANNLKQVVYVNVVFFQIVLKDLDGCITSTSSSFEPLVVIGPRLGRLGSEGETSTSLVPTAL